MDSIQPSSIGRVGQFASRGRTTLNEELLWRNLAPPDAGMVLQMQGWFWHSGRSGEYCKPI